jgi:hypothetical protein
MLYGQDENSLKGKTGPVILSEASKNPSIIMDGLILSKSDYLKLNIDKSYSKKFRINVLNEKESAEEYNVFNKDGIVKIKTNLLYVIDNKPLTVKNKVSLSKLDSANIIYMKMLNKEDAIKAYGKLGGNGALLIKTK